MKVFSKSENLSNKIVTENKNMSILSSMFNFFATKKNIHEESHSSKQQKTRQPLDPSSFCYHSKSRNELSFKEFPIIDIQSKPERQEFKELKREFVERAFLAVSEYYEYIIENDHLVGKTEIKEIIAVTIKQFIEFFWDLPASENVNYTEQFGLLKKSLKDACARADRGENINVNTKDGTISSERTRICRPYYILVEFILGLFENSSIIFNTKMTSIKNGKHHSFYPFWGSLLNFKMVFPHVNTEWLQSNIDVRLNYILLIYLTPFSFIQVLPDEVRKHFLEKFVSEGISSENKKKVVINNHTLQNQLDYIQNEFAKIYKESPTIIDVPRYSNIYRVSKEYYVVTENEFFGLMFRAAGFDREKALEFFKKSKLAIFNENQFSLKLPFYYLNDIKEKENDKRKPTINPQHETFVFIKNVFFEPVVQIVGGNTGEFIEPIIRFDTSMVATIQEFLGDENPKIPSKHFYNPKIEKEPIKNKGDGQSKPEKKKDDSEENTPVTTTSQNENLETETQAPRKNENANIPSDIFGSKPTLDDVEFLKDAPESISDPLDDDGAVPDNDESEHSPENIKIIEVTASEEKSQQAMKTILDEDTTLQKNVDDFFADIDTKNTTIQNDQMKKRNIGFFDIEGNLYVYLSSIVKACYKYGPCTKEISRTILDWLYDNDIILDIDGMFFKNINVKYYPVSEDPLDVPEVKTKEAHFVRINLEAIKSYPSFTEQLEEIQKINNLMN
jgi:hypothetical protein